MRFPLHLLVAASLAGLVGGAGTAFGQAKSGPGGAAQTPAPPSPAPQTSPGQATDAAFEAARAAFEPLPEAERKAIQDALAWVAGYNSVVSGAFGRRTYDAILAYQRRANLKTDGILTAPGRASLFAAAKRARDAVRFAVITDERSGVQIGIPQATLPKREPNTSGGTRWQSADGRITLDTRALPEGEGDLAALYERLVNNDAPGRKVTYKLLRPDFLVVSGETQTGRFYIRYAQGSAGLRGFSLGYEKAVAAGFDPLVIAIANSFAPSAGSPNPAVAVSPPRPDLHGAASPLASGPVGSGVVVAPRRVLAVGPAPSCPDLRTPRGRARVLAADRASGLMLLEVEGVGAIAPPSARTGSAPADEGVIVLSAASAGLVAAPGHVDGAGRLLAPLQPGASGGAVLDRSGALVGVVGALPTAPRVVAGIVPPLSHPVVTVSAIGSFLDAQQLRLSSAEPRPARSAGEITAPVAGAVVPLLCGR